MKSLTTIFQSTPLPASSAATLALSSIFNRCSAPSIGIGHHRISSTTSFVLNNNNLPSFHLHRPRQSSSSLARAMSTFGLRDKDTPTPSSSSSSSSSSSPSLSGLHISSPSLGSGSTDQGAPPISLSAQNEEAPWTAQGMPCSVTPGSGLPSSFVGPGNVSGQQQASSPMSGSPSSSVCCSTPVGSAPSSSFSTSSSSPSPSMKTLFNESSGARVPIWFEDRSSSSGEVGSPPSFPPLTKDERTQVAIIGAGIAGLTTAYHLVGRGYDVIVVDSRQLAAGESGRTSAHLSSYMDDGIAELVNTHGVDTTRMITESHAHAIDMIENIVKQHSIQCDFKRIDGYLFDDGSSNAEKHALDKEWEAIKLCNAYPTSSAIDHVLGNIPGMAAGRALRFPKQAQFHPLKYLIGLSKILNENIPIHPNSKRGTCKIYSHTPIVKYEGGGNAYIQSKDGQKIWANHIVMCSNVPLSLLSMIDSVKPMRTYLISAPVLKNSIEQCLWWDNNDPYHYVRVIPGEVHSNQDYIIIGGEDHVVGRDDGRSPEDRYRALETWGRERWPNIGPIHNRWSGQVEEPLDGIAYMGRNPHDYDNVFIVTGDSGMGLTHGTIGGEVICDLIDRKENKYAAIYDPGRLRLKSVPEYLARNTATQFQFARYLAPSEVNDIEDIAPCSGAVMREGLRPVAVYKDEHGKIFKCSAICTHLKGVVRWNNDEKTWDCPVHGSRFKPHGQVVNGPAINPLPPIKD